MAARRPLTSDDKLAALRKGDPARRWLSLDDRCTCVLCERTFTGRQVEVAINALGRVRLRCPSEGCNGTPREWVHPGNPLVSQKAWSDWERALKKVKDRRISKPNINILGATA